METIQNFSEITKKDFPLLNKNSKSSEQIIYLDHAATTQKPIQVLEKINEYSPHDLATRLIASVAFLVKIISFSVFAFIYC